MMKITDYNVFGAYGDSDKSDHTNDNFYPIPYSGIKIANPPRILGGYNDHIELYSPCFKSRGFIHGISNCRTVTYYKNSLGITQEALDDLENMLHFRSEPIYEQPYRLIANSKLCLKGNCHTVSSILRPGF